MRRMTVWKSCHGVCNLEACFFGGDLHGWWKLRALPTKTGILTCLTLLMRSPADTRQKLSLRLITARIHTFLKKTRPHNAASSVLVHDEVGLDRPSVRHVLVCLIDFIQLIAVREDLARIDLTVKDRLQQDFLVIGRH